MSARPFVKWIGGKAGLADEILSEFPPDFDVYVEPFVGGGAVLFRVLQAFPQVRAVINDANSVLVDTYRAVRDDPRAREWKRATPFLGAFPRKKGGAGEEGAKAQRVVLTLPSLYAQT